MMSILTGEFVDQQLADLRDVWIFLDDFAHFSGNHYYVAKVREWNFIATMESRTLISIGDYNFEFNTINSIKR